MNRIFFLLALILITGFSLFPREGMWLPLLLEKYNIDEMQQKGLRLSAEEIYSINQASLKDAVVRIGGCSGVVVSDRGLVLTNHHCAYRAIQSHSTIENDYLTEGFWAMSEDEELPNPGLSVTFLVRMEDVTERILSVLDEDMDNEQRQEAVLTESRLIEKETVEDTRYRAEVNSFFYGNEYYLFVYDVFEDIRLVGAPPSSIGKFGGDTDNWIWPRHTGDFAFFRIYAENGKVPAQFSHSNIPYRSPVSAQISTGGVNEDDFTMVFGFPGSTSQYLTSHAVRLITEMSNPHNIRLRDERLRIMGNAMDINDTVRIKYASKFAGVSNAWKRWQGENRGLERLEALERKKRTEERFARWVESRPDLRESYSCLLPAFDSLYGELERYLLPRDYGREALYAIEIVRFVSDFIRVSDAMVDRDQEISAISPFLESTFNSFFTDYHKPVDREIFVSMLEMYRDNIETGFHPVFFDMVRDEFEDDFSAFADHVFSETVFVDRQDLAEMLESGAQDLPVLIEDDILVRIVRDIGKIHNEYVVPSFTRIEQQLEPLYRKYVEGLRMMKPDHVFYPDANRTPRVSYGLVKGYYPSDAVYYNSRTTLSGVIEKNRTGLPEYAIPEKLEQLHQSRDFGPWSADGEMRTNFIASNHTTGGNSGSPVFNAGGHLIGLNFDRVWEGTMSDIMFDPEMCRNISVDINYILFITDRFAGAGHLLDEMTFSDEPSMITSEK